MFQANQAHAQIANVFGDFPGWITGATKATVTFAVINFSDAAIFAMSVVNIFALYFLMKIVKRELTQYSTRLKGE